MEFRQLIIMRHAKSDWDNTLKSDFDRPLNDRGMIDAPRMASWLEQWMSSNNLAVDLLISSPAHRAKQTSNQINAQLKLSQDDVIFDKRMYLASTNVLLSIIREIDDKYKNVMLIGHNPGLENLSMELTKDKLPLNEDGSLMTTANIVHLRTTQLWKNIKSNDAEFVQLMRPKQLP